MIFGVLLLLMAIGLLLSLEDIYDSDLPTLALVNEMNPVPGVIAAVATYLMIFSTALGVFDSLGKRLAAPRPQHFRLIYVVVSLTGFGLGFMRITSLVNKVFPWLGWLGIVFTLVLPGSWFMSGCTDISQESLRRDRTRALVLYRLDPQRRWTPRHANALIQAVDESNLRAKHLGDFMERRRPGRGRPHLGDRDPGPERGRDRRVLHHGAALGARAEIERRRYQRAAPTRPARPGRTGAEAPVATSSQACPRSCGRLGGRAPPRGRLVPRRAAPPKANR